MKTMQIVTFGLMILSVAARAGLGQSAAVPTPVYVDSDKDGKFKFDKIAKGLYRVIARIDGLCTANIPVKIESSPLADRRLIITMRPKDIDTCSYGMAKR